ncbi:putative ribonuclease H-like domain-containing protein [Tanacetum coccineum]
MDVKSAFLYGKIEEEVYVCQPPGFEDPNFPARVYKVKKALYGLHQAPKAWYETLLTYLLDNEFQRGKIDKTLFIKRHKGDILLVQVYVDDIIFSSTKKELCNAFEKFTEVKTASTPIKTQKPLLKDENGKEVDIHMYRLMIGSLMYLTSARPDIMFAVCACARYQVNLNVSHLHAVKRIFRYLKAQPKLGLWYLKDSPFDLVAYIDSDYAGASLDRKSTTREAEYVAASSCCGQAKTVNGEVQLEALLDGKKIIITESTVRRDLQLEDAEGVDCLPNATIFEQLALMGPKKKDTRVPQSSVPSDNVVDEVVYKELDDNFVRAATTASSLEAEQDGGNINTTRSKTTPNEAGSQGTTSSGGPSCQETMGDTIAQTRFENVSKFSNDPLFQEVLEDIYTTRIVMKNPDPLNEPNEAILEENLVIPDPNQVVDVHDPNEMVDIPDDVDLVDYDGDNEENPEEDPEEDLEEDPKEELESNNGLVNQSAPHVDPHQPDVMIVWLEENDGVNEGVNNEDIKDEDVEIELDDDAELIFPYEVEDDKTLPPGGVSSNSEPPNAEPPNTESSDSVSSDSESEEKEADVAPEDTFGTITQRPYVVRDFPRGVFEAGEPSSAHDSSYVGGLAPRALRHFQVITQRRVSEQLLNGTVVFTEHNYSKNRTLTFKTNEAIPEENPVIPDPNQVVDVHDPNEMVDISNDVDLVDYDGDDEENPEKDPEEDPEEEPEPNNGLWNDGVNEGVNNEDIEDEDVEIELDDDAELIFPYEVEGDKTLPHGGMSSNSKPPNAEPPNAESSNYVASDSELEEKEADVAPEDTFGTITQRPLYVRDFCGCIEASRARSRVTEAELRTCQTKIALL